MTQRLAKKSLGIGFPGQMLMGCLLVLNLQNTPPGQQNRATLVRLYKLEGTFGTELPVTLDHDEKPDALPFALTGARIEDDKLGFLSRIRSILTITNRDGKRRITGVEWRLDVYDPGLKTMSLSVLQTDNVKIYPGETASASSKFGAVLPDRMIVLLQLLRVDFGDDSSWVSPVECSLGEDLRTVACDTR